MKVVPSILSVLNQNLDEVLSSLEKTSVQYLHLDVMDNQFVPNYTFDEEKVKEIKKKTSLMLDTHLMIQDPVEKIDRYIQTGSDFLCFHIEAASNPLVIIEKIKQASLKVGIAIKPKTKIDVLLPYLKVVDLILVMSVEPGFGGQAFMEEVLEKTRKLKELKTLYHYSYLIEMDGGINNENKNLIKNAGCDLIVVGSYLFKQKDLCKTIRELEE